MLKALLMKWKQPCWNPNNRNILISSMEHISESVLDIQPSQTLPVSLQSDISYVWYIVSGKSNTTLEQTINVVSEKYMWESLNRWKEFAGIPAVVIYVRLDHYSSINGYNIFHQSNFTNRIHIKNWKDIQNHYNSSWGWHECVCIYISQNYKSEPQGGARVKFRASAMS